tara:strand:+ start:182 stop:406 length:225 start_codon:yes stop_codon:yes gene_type:complete
MGKPQKVVTLLEERKKIEREIERIQNLCKHPSKSVKSVRERLDSTTMVIRYVCDMCLLPIGYPNDKEQQDYLKQ